MIIRVRLCELLFATFLLKVVALWLVGISSMRGEPLVVIQEIGAYIIHRGDLIGYLLWNQIMAYKKPDHWIFDFIEFAFRGCDPSLKMGRIRAEKKSNREDF